MSATRRWEVQKVIKIPKSAAFEDYSDLAFAPGPRGGGVKNQLAITSQVHMTTVCCSTMCAQAYKP
jgi:hypothetical protein